MDVLHPFSTPITVIVAVCLPSTHSQPSYAVSSILAQHPGPAFRHRTTFKNTSIHPLPKACSMAIPVAIHEQKKSFPLTLFLSFFWGVLEAVGVISCLSCVFPMLLTCFLSCNAIWLAETVLLRTCCCYLFVLGVVLALNLHCATPAPSVENSAFISLPQMVLDGHFFSCHASCVVRRRCPRCKPGSLPSDPAPRRHTRKGMECVTLGQAKFHRRQGAKASNFFFLL